MEQSKQFACILLMLTGAAIMLIPMAYSFFTILLPKTPAIGITFVGAVIGTWLFQKGLRQYKLDAGEGSISAKEHHKAIANATIEAKQKVRKLEEEKRQLEIKKDRLQKMALNVNTVKPVFKATLLEIETSLKDFKKKEIERVETKAGWLSGGNIKNTEYIGYIDQKIIAQFGINLEEIRVREEDTRIIVSGVKCKYHGTLERSTTERHHEVREIFISPCGKGTLLSGNILTPTNDINQLLEKERESHRDELEKRVNSGVDLVGLTGADTFVEKSGQELIRLFLLQTGKPIVFVQETVTNGRSLEDYTRWRTGEVSKQIGKINEELKRLEAQ